MVVLQNPMLLSPSTNALVVHGGKGGTATVLWVCVYFPKAAKNHV